jgi:hypothetical protein
MIKSVLFLLCGVLDIGNILDVGDVIESIIAEQTAII